MNEIQYARNGGVSIAYQVVGSGETDLVPVPDYLSNLVFWWLSPHWRSFYERLAQSFRLILFDKRGTGLSDHGAQFATLETRMEDMRAVLDAAGSDRAVVSASHEGTLMSALYAAAYPERTTALVLFHPVVAGPGIDSREIQETSAICARGGARARSPTNCSSLGARRSTPTRGTGRGSSTRCGSGRVHRSRMPSTGRTSRATSAMFFLPYGCRRSFSTGRVSRRRTRTRSRSRA
jgi:pimeloyl-ACP methyl ester carboxylesterase